MSSSPLRDRYVAFAIRQPEWLVPPLLGAGMVLELTGRKALLAGPPLLLILLWRRGVSEALMLAALIPVVFIAGAVAGFFGGLAFTALTPLAKRWPVVGSYLRGIGGVAAYMTPFVAGIIALDPPRLHISSPVPFIVLSAVLAVVFGVIIGKPGTAKKAWQQRRQRVTSRVHPPAG